MHNIFEIKYSHGISTFGSDGLLFLNLLLSTYIQYIAKLGLMWKNVQPFELTSAVSVAIAGNVGDYVVAVVFIIILE